MGAKRANATSFGGKRGNPRGEQPGPGRLPQVYARRMQLALEAANIEAILKDPTHPQFMKALEFAANRGFGKVPDQTEHSGEVVVRVVRDE